MPGERPSHDRRDRREGTCRDAEAPPRGGRQRLAACAARFCRRDRSPQTQRPSSSASTSRRTVSTSGNSGTREGYRCRRTHFRSIDPRSRVRRREGYGRLAPHKAREDETASGDLNEVFPLYRDLSSRSLRAGLMGGGSAREGQDPIVPGREAASRTLQAHRSEPDQHPGRRRLRRRGNDSAVPSYPPPAGAEHLLCQHDAEGGPIPSSCLATATMRVCSGPRDALQGPLPRRISAADAKPELGDHGARISEGAFGRIRTCHLARGIGAILMSHALKSELARLSSAAGRTPTHRHLVPMIPDARVMDAAADATPAARRPRRGLFSLAVWFVRFCTADL